MISSMWKDKIEWHLKMASEAKTKRDKRDLAYRTSIVGENVINILRFSIDGKAESTFFMIVSSIKRYMALGILSKDYMPILSESYEYYKLDTYINTSSNSFSFHRMEILHCEICNLVKEVESYLKKEGKM
ncbi:hypothetical protein psyc5s11_30440 [Clostridium gelidum]|uniref:Four helix bundle protein n=1 Tax=Clostridium gelidum TaxID=704125 RepID=A0ABM7T6S5_9CLOT|nr:hypothetical protein [Clostridium gelidum]BCZ46977.1 hypothetical protein psyc5s11_30440 [Clostridium gelidum]